MVVTVTDIYTCLARLQLQETLVAVGDAVGAANVEEDLGAVRVAAGRVVREGIAAVICRSINS